MSVYGMVSKLFLFQLKINLQIFAWQTSVTRHYPKIILKLNFEPLKQNFAQVFQRSFKMTNNASLNCLNKYKYKFKLINKIRLKFTKTFLRITVV
jgi:hypothetical protein